MSQNNKQMKFFLTIITSTFLTITTIAQTKNDSIITIQPQQKTLKPKVEHAEPLYTDLMRDLGARKGGYPNESSRVRKGI
ncbi:hypothetical protein ACTS91_07155 [Empedobacter falsenii]